MVSRTSTLLALLVIADIAVFTFADGTCDPTSLTACPSHTSVCLGTCSSDVTIPCSSTTICKAAKKGTCSGYACKCPVGFTGDNCQTKSSTTATRGSLPCLMLIVIPMMMQLVRL